MLVEVIFGILFFGIVFLTMLCVHLCIFLFFLICSSALCSCWLLFTCDKAEILLVLCCNLPDINLFVFFTWILQMVWTFWPGHFAQWGVFRPLASALSERQTAAVEEEEDTNLLVPG